jgi:lysozyme family protein
MATTLSTEQQQDYQFLFNTCIINQAKYPEIDNYVQKMNTNQETYQAVSNAVNVPWYFIAIIHCMEGSLSFKTHLHNGDPLNARTIHVPKDRPIAGSAPFSWEDSAIDSLKLEGFTAWDDWSISGILYSWEKYNGFGYRKKGINSPYLWSYSNQYTKGKFTDDGVFDPDAVSKQCGAAVLLRRMSEKQMAIKGDTDTITQIKQLGEQVVYDSANVDDKARQLQTLLNSIGQHLRIDGVAARNTSDAFFSIAGKYLQGDPSHLS